MAHYDVPSRRLKISQVLAIHNYQRHSTAWWEYSYSLHSSHRNHKIRSFSGWVIYANFFLKFNLASGLRQLFLITMQIRIRCLIRVDFDLTGRVDTALILWTVHLTAATNGHLFNRLSSVRGEVAYSWNPAETDPINETTGSNQCWALSSAWVLVIFFRSLFWTS